jgi:Mg-chelatase subunit ChlD
MKLARVFGATVSVSLLASLAACTVSSDDPNAQVDQVTVVGTAVTADVYVSKSFGVRMIPTRAADGSAVLSNDLAVKVRISSPEGINVTVDKTECSAPADANAAVNVGVVIDDSGSMSGSDPKRQRKDAFLAFLKTLRATDPVLFTDYGATGSQLRDLVCASNGGAAAKCSPIGANAFTTDRAALTKAADLIQPSGGTPLYESCVEMVKVLQGVSGRRAMLLLSDGQPNSMSQRDACHGAAKAASIPVYTVGLGPAAEGDVQKNDTAVKVLRELATETGGAYASADVPDQLDRLFVAMGSAVTKGSCSSTARIAEIDKVVPGTRVSGEIEVGAKGAVSKFEFVAPAK